MTLPIPYVRMDWLADRLTRGSPLAEDVASLAELGQALQKEGFPKLGSEKQVPCGPRPRPFGGGNPVLAAAKPESAAAILPLGAWYSGDCQAATPPFALNVEAIAVKGETPKKLKPGTPFQLQVSTDRDVRFVLLKVMGDDGSIVVQPTNKGGFLKAGDKAIVTPPNGEAFVIPGAGAEETTVYFVLLASATELPPPVVLVRSRHSQGLDCEQQQRYPVSRFFLDADMRPDGFDRAGVVRRVVPVTFGKE